jgi:8-oxo-dGTP pyrophosphatase MutT (NUDIX family)
VEVPSGLLDGLRTGVRFIFSEGEIRQRLLPSTTQFPQPAHLDPAPRVAARPGALVPALDGEWQLLFTERSDDVADHKGQVSFPGGQVHAEDADLMATALRETDEEIGLPSRQVRVLGILEPMLTVTNFWVTPVVGAFDWPRTFHLAPIEVKEVFGTPLRWLADPTNLEWMERDHPITGEKVVAAIYAPYNGHTIWGVTARIVLQVLSALARTSA